MTTPKDELSEAIRESVAQLRRFVRLGREDQQMEAALQLSRLDYPTLTEVFGDPDSPDHECEYCAKEIASLEGKIEEKHGYWQKELGRALSAEAKLSAAETRLTALEFDAKQSQEAVDDAFKTVHRWLDQCGAPRDAVETEDGDKTELSLQKRIEWLGRGVKINASLLKYAIRWRSDWPSDRSKDHPDWVECNAAIEAVGVVKGDVSMVAGHRVDFPDGESHFVASGTAPIVRVQSNEASAIEIRRLKRKLAKARERRDFFSGALTAVLRHEGAPPGGVNAFVDAIKGRDMRIAGLLEKLDRIGVEFASKEAAITGLVNAQEEAIKALDGELRIAYRKIGHAVHVLNEAGFVCDQESMGKAVVDMAHALVVAKGELSSVRK